jgi:hypothetical protein
VPWISLLQAILNIVDLNQSGAGIIRNCTKPPPGIKLGIKVDNHGYQTQKKNQMFDFDIYNRVYQKNQIPGYYFSNTRINGYLKNQIPIPTLV